MILVSHLKRVGMGKSHEDGGQISLSHLRGSQAIAQLSDIVIGLERDQQAKNPIIAKYHQGSHSKEPIHGQGRTFAHTTFLSRHGTSVGG